MDSFQSFQLTTLNFEEKNGKSKLHEIFKTKNTKLLINFVRSNPEFGDKFKFALLLFAVTWENNNILSFMYKQFENEYRRNLGWAKEALISQIYSKDLIKIYELAFIDCFLNKEYFLIKEIFSPQNCPITLKEKFFISVIKKISIDTIIQIANLEILYFPIYSLEFKDHLNKVKLGKLELLKILCKSKIGFQILYNFIINYYNLNEAICILIKAKYNKVIQILLYKCDFKSLDFDRFFKIAAKSQNYKFIISYYFYLEKKRTFSPTLNKMLDFLIYNFCQNTCFIDFRIYLISVLVRFLNVKQANDIIYKLQRLVSSKDIERNYLLFVSNPIKTLLMMYELTFFIKRRFSSLNGLCTEFSQFILNTCKTIFSSIENYSELYLILEDKLFNKEKTCDLIYKYNLIELMKNSQFHLYIKRCWDNSCVNTINLHELSTPLKFIREDCTPNPLFQFKDYLVLNKGYIRGSYIDYIRNPSTKFAFYVMFQLMVGIVLFVFLIVMNSNLRETTEIMGRFFNSAPENVIGIIN